MFVAIDGTGSKENAMDYRGADGAALCLNLSVANFYEDYGAGDGAVATDNKVYFPGPDLSGNGLAAAVEQGYAFLLKKLSFSYRLNKAGAKGTGSAAAKHFSAAAFQSQAGSTGADLLTGEATISKLCAMIVDLRFAGFQPRFEALAQTGEPIDLLGYSRGALGVLLLARKLSRIPLMSADTVEARIRFMGLYDAVARYSFDSANQVPDNVDQTYQAMRDDAVGSRSYFGHAIAEEYRARGYQAKIFRGTHGALGGDPMHGDRVTGVSPLTAIIMRTAGGAVGMVAAELLRQRTLISVKDNQEAAIAADTWMRASAQSVGVPIGPDVRCHVMLSKWVGDSITPVGRVSQRLYAQP